MMKEDHTLGGYLPETFLLSDSVFWKQLSDFGALIIKPSEGSRGYGVVQVSQLGENRFEIHSNNSKLICDRNGLEGFLDKEKYSRKLYVLQKKIPLATVEGSPFDIRVMVERKKDSNQWQVTGRLAKVAAKGYFITNIAREILTLNQAFERSSIKDIDIPIITAELDSISLLTAYQLQEYYPGANVLGLDIGITNTGDIYIIEANLKPSRAMFRRLKE